jgi:hypothetical protein
MKKILALAFLLIAVATVNATAATVTVNFDDLTPAAQSNFGKIPTSYAGLTWNGTSWEFTTEGPTGLNNTLYLAPSMPNVAYNGDGASPLTVSLQGGGLFNYLGAYYSTLVANDEVQAPNEAHPDFYDYASDTVTVNGYRNGNRLYSTTYNLGISFEQHAANYSGIDLLEFVNDGGQNPDGLGTFFMMDDLAYSTQEGPSTVPEPTSLLLLSTGLGGMLLAFKRKQSKK